MQLTFKARPVPPVMGAALSVRQTLAGLQLYELAGLISAVGVGRLVALVGLAQQRLFRISALHLAR